MKVFAAILAGGSGTRFGGDKALAPLRGRPVWRWSYDVYAAHPRIAGVGVVGSASNLDQILETGAPFAFAQLGGGTRQESSRIAVEACPDDVDVLLIHDAARPFVRPSVIDQVIDAIARTGAAAAAVPTIDTLREEIEGGYRIVDRQQTFAMQTPQGARLSLLRQAHRDAKEDYTDDLALIEAIGHPIELAEGDPANYKITLPEDLQRAGGLLPPMETRTGLGYDIHPFTKAGGRTLMLGGVPFPGHAALDGHSDADVLIHALVDAILGAAGLGDIGQHFPNTDARWQGEPSVTFLRRARELVFDEGYDIVNVDITAIAETPKIMPQAERIRETLAAALGIAPGRVSVKATTNERLGAIGRGEGIAAHAVATLTRATR